jgi:cytochrome P450
MGTLSLTPADGGKVFVRPEAYADEALFHAACAVLRAEDPVHLVEDDKFAPFWVLTKHADVHDVSRNAAAFRNAPRPVLQTREADRIESERGAFLRTLIHMDDPDHRVYRALTAEWFLPKSLAGLEERFADLARRSIDSMAELGGECDFARDIAMPFPLQVILAVLGLPESDYARMLKLTQELFGGTDDDVRRQGDNLTEALMEVLADFFAYFSAITEQRRARPTGDLASVIANATIDGRPLEPLECISYYVIIATAGHDTTSSSMAGGLQALIENPDELDRLRGDATLMAAAVEEMIRWVSPVRHFMRNCAEPAVVRGHGFRPGDKVLLSYPSANRDEEVFADSMRFDVGRAPNKHLAFGFGAHYCLGAQLARMEMKALFTELLARVDELELAGQPQLTKATFVGGLKSLPIRYRVT